MSEAGASEETMETRHQVEAVESRF